MKKFVALLMRGKRPGNNGKMMTLTFFEQLGQIRQIRTIFFHELLALHCSVASCNK